MEISYWLSRWQKQNIGWHMNKVYPQLPKIWPLLSFTSNPRVLVPMCGKSLDMSWLAEQGCKVIGVEVSKRALSKFRNAQTETFQRDSIHGFTIYRSSSFELWEGDFFKLPSGKISAIDVIYDKAAFVALPPDMRKDYSKKILELCGQSTQILLQIFEYNQDEMNGPPFSIPEDEIQQNFGEQFSIELIHEQSKLDELNKFQRRGLSSYLKEKIYYLTPIQVQ